MPQQAVEARFTCTTSSRTKNSSSMRLVTLQLTSTSPRTSTLRGQEVTTEELKKRSACPTTVSGLHGMNRQLSSK